MEEDGRKKLQDELEDIWKLSTFADVDEQRRKDGKRNIIAGYFLNLSAATFTGMVLGMIVSISYRGFDTLSMSIIIVGMVSTIALAWIGYHILKMY